MRSLLILLLLGLVCCTSVSGQFDVPDFNITELPIEVQEFTGTDCQGSPSSTLSLTYGECTAANGRFYVVASSVVPTDAQFSALGVFNGDDSQCIGTPADTILPSNEGTCVNSGNGNSYIVNCPDYNVSITDPIPFPIPGIDDDGTDIPPVDGGDIPGAVIIAQRCESNDTSDVQLNDGECTPINGRFYIAKCLPQGGANASADFDASLSIFELGDCSSSPLVTFNGNSGDCLDSGVAGEEKWLVNCNSTDNGNGNGDGNGNGGGQDTDGDGVPDEGGFGDGNGNGNTDGGNTDGGNPAPHHQPAAIVFMMLAAALFALLA